MCTNESYAIATVGDTNHEDFRRLRHGTGGELLRSETTERKHDVRQIWIGAIWRVYGSA